MNPIRFKATTPAGTDPAGLNPASGLPAGSPAAPLSTDQAKELQSKLQDALQQAYQANDQYEEYETLPQKAAMDLQIAQLKGYLALVTNFVETGLWDVNFGGSGPATTSETDTTGTSADYMEVQNEWKPGWNGSQISASDDADKRIVPADGTYMGTVYDQANADPSKPPQIAFKLDENAVDFKVYNHGQDLIIRQELADRTVQYWVGKNWVTKIDVQLFFDASAVKQHDGTLLNVDFSGAYRIGSSGANFGKTPDRGFTIRGSQFADAITGSQNKDTIFGGAGNDQIDGQGDDDYLFGDDTLANPLTHKAALVFGESISNDTILGNGGNDYIDAGGGINTGFDTDNADDRLPGNIQKTAPHATVTPFDHSWWSSDGSWQVANGSLMNGEVAMERTGNNTRDGRLELTMPTGFDMATASQDGNGSDAVVTFVGKDSNGHPISQKIRIRGFFDQPPLHLVVNGNDASNIIDFHGITNQNHTNIIELHGMGGDGDMLFGAQNALTRDGLDPHTMFSSSSSVTNRGDALIPIANRSDQLKVDPNANGTALEVTKDGTKIESNDLRIDAPAGYDQAYYIRSGANADDVTVVLVKPGAGEIPAERIVIHIKKAGPNFVPNVVHALDVNPATGPGEDTASALPPTSGGGQIVPILLPGTKEDFLGLGILDGGDGADFLFGSTSDYFHSDQSGEVLQGSYATTLPPSGDTSGGATGGTSGSAGSGSGTAGATEGSSGTDTGGGTGTGSGTGAAGTSGA